MPIFSPLIVDPAVQGFRLTTETGVAVSTTNQTAKTSVFITPYNGANIALCNGTAGQWYYLTMQAQATVALGTVVSGRPYDVFAYNSGGTLAGEILAWSSTTARATAVTLTNGVYLKSGDLTRRLVGTLYTTSTTQTIDTDERRFVVNVDNVVDRKLYSYNTDGSWNYSTASYRESNGGTGQVRAEWVQPLAGPTYLVEGSQNINGTSSGARWAAGFKLTNTVTGKSAFTNANGITLNMTSQGFITPAVGYNWVTMIEYVDGGTATYSGTEGGGACYVHIKC